MTIAAPAPPPTLGFSPAKARLLLAITAGYGLSYTSRLVFGVVKKPLIDSGAYTPAQLGTIGSALFFAYAVGKLVNGFLGDHVNIRWFVALGFLASAACNLGMIAAPSLLVATMLWGVNGWFQSFGAPGCIISIARSFDDTTRGRAYGIWSTSHSIGEGLTFFAVGGIAAAFGWHAGFWGASIACTFAAVLVLVLMPRAIARDGHARKTRMTPGERRRLFREQLRVLRLWPIWLLGLASAASYVTRYGINSWGFLWLQEDRGFDAAGAGTILMVSNLAGIAGSIALGYISDLWFAGRRPPVNLLFGLLEVSGLIMAFWLGGSSLWLWIGLILFGLGLGGINASVGGLFAVDLAPKRFVGACMGMIGSFSYLGSALQEEISGRLIERGMTVTGGVHHYDFTAVTLFWTGAAVASVVLASLLWRAKEQVVE